MGLLALLEAGPSHGYELKAAFAAGTGGVWALNVGQVYSTLEHLAKDGLVEPVGQGVLGGQYRTQRLATANAGGTLTSSWSDASPGFPRGRASPGAGPDRLRRW